MIHISPHTNYIPVHKRIEINYPTRTCMLAPDERILTQHIINPRQLIP